MSYWYQTRALAAAKPVALLMALSLLIVALPAEGRRPGVVEAAPAAQVPPG